MIKRGDTILLDDGRYVKVISGSPKKGWKCECKGRTYHIDHEILNVAEINNFADTMGTKEYPLKGTKYLPKNAD